MPSKSQKAASRQAKLREKRRRGRPAPQEFQRGPTRSLAAEEESDQEVAPRSASRQAAAGAATLAASPVRRTARSALAERAPSYQYLRSEMRRIGVIASLIVVILIALSFVMGG